jgi:DNA-binding GntR family transcriptional regulator
VSVSEPLERRSVAEAVKTRLRDAILEGTLAPGEPFSVVQLSEELGISHIPIREALRGLESEGFVQFRHARSAIVAPLDADEATEVFRLRCVLEESSLREAVPNYDASHIAMLRDLAGEMRKASDDKDGETYSRLHEEFEWALLEPIMSPWLRRVLGLLRQATDRYYRVLIVRRGDEIARKDEHEAFVDAAAAGDVEQICSNLREHLKTTLEEVLFALAERPTASEGRASP